MSNGQTYLSGEQQQALMGRWVNIVGQALAQSGVTPLANVGPAERSGVPSHHQHGVYGGHHQAHGGMYGNFNGFPPRNALIDAPGPTQGRREVLPMSSGVPIGYLLSAQITSRPQRVAFRPERVFISNGGTQYGAADWIVNDISIGNRSQFAQSGQLPGDMFSNASIDSFVSFETAQTAMDIVMVVTYVGANISPASAPFYGGIIGTSAV